MTLYAVGTPKPTLSSSRNGTTSGNSSSSSASSLVQFLAPIADGIGTATQLEKNPYALALALVPLLTIFGNALVILAVCRDKTLRTVTNLLIMSLAISDLLVALCVMFFAVYYEWNSFVWDLGPTLCNLYIGADVACSTASILNLLAISIDRYIAISHPLAYCQIGTNSRAYVSIALVWGVSISVAIPVAFGANHIESEHECAFTNPVFMISSSILSFFLPCLAMIALYAVVFRRLRERESARTARKRHATLNGTETALIATALMGGARMARQIARSHLKDQLLLELSIQTSSFPTASLSGEEDDDEEDEEEEDVAATDGCQSDRDTARHNRRWHNYVVMAQTQHQAEMEQQRRPTLGLMVNGGMPFPMAPMNPLQLPSTALTEAERRVKGWRRKRTLRLVRRCNTLPTTVMMQRSNMPTPQGTTTASTTTTTTVGQQQESGNAAKCQLNHQHRQHDHRTDRPKSALFFASPVFEKAARHDAHIGGVNQHVLLEHEQQKQRKKMMGDDYDGGDGDGDSGADQHGHGQQQQKGDAPAKPPEEEGEGQIWHPICQPNAPNPVHLCSSFGDELKECFPFIDQSNEQYEIRQSALPCALDVPKSPSASLFGPSIPPKAVLADPSSVSNYYIKRHHQHNNRSIICSGWIGTASKKEKREMDKGRQCHAEKRLQCHHRRNGHLAQCVDGGGLRRAHSARHPAREANFAFRHEDEQQLLIRRRLSEAAADASWWCTACVGRVAVAVNGRGRNDSNYFDTNIYNNNKYKHDDDNDNNKYNHDNNKNNTSSSKSAVIVLNKQQQQSQSGGSQSATTSVAADTCCTKATAAAREGPLALRNGGGVPLLLHKKQRKRRKQFGAALLARFIHWTREQQQAIAGLGSSNTEGPRLVGVIETATTVGVISAVKPHNKSVRRNGTARRSVRISSRSPSERKPEYNSGNGAVHTQRTGQKNDHCWYAVTQPNTNNMDGREVQGEGMDQTQTPPADWNNNTKNDTNNNNNDDNDDKGAESSAALSSSYRLLLDGTTTACCMAEQFKNTTPSSPPPPLSHDAGDGHDGSPWRNGSNKCSNGIVPSRKGGGGGGGGGYCQRASTVTGVPKKTSCASSTFSSSPLRYIRQAFRRSLVPIIEEGRKPSRALLKRATRQMRREQRATVTLAIVLAVFLCCWVPFFALHLSNAVCLLSDNAQCVHLLAMFLTTWLGYLNSSLNPLIYTVFDKRFRKAFHNLLGCAAGPGSAIDRRRGARPAR